MNNSSINNCKTKNIKIGIIAPSAKVPVVELKLGVERIREEGFTVNVHPQCKKGHLFFAGTDQERAGAFFEFAHSLDHQVIWCARGGHGAIRLLPLLEEMTSQKAVPPPKLLVGYSDVTALMEYVRKRWGWHTLHASMPSWRKFPLIKGSDWEAMVGWICQKSVEPPWVEKDLTFWTPMQVPLIQAPVVGGNLTVWNCLLGTRFQGKAEGCILFLEDVDESLYRIDRMMQQLLLSGSLDRVQAILLGNFMNCRDYPPRVLKAVPPLKLKERVLESPKENELKPLRKVLKEQTTLKNIFGEIGDRLKIPVVSGLPVGHGPEVSPFPLGAEYCLTDQGKLRLMQWDWCSRIG